MTLSSKNFILDRIILCCIITNACIKSIDLVDLAFISALII